MKNQLTGMTGVYLVAAELSRRGFVVATTSRSAQGADLLVTDLSCENSYAVQVKTNATSFGFWLLNAKAKNLKSASLIYALVNLRKDETEYYLVPSRVVSAKMKTLEPTKTRKSTWYAIYKKAIEEYRDNWTIIKPANKREVLKPRDTEGQLADESEE